MFTATALPPAGSELEFGVEGGQYRFTGGCGATQNQADYAALQVRYRHSTEEGWGVNAEAAARLARVSRTTIVDPEEGASNVGDTRHAGLLALRAGYHGRYGGLELGPALGTLTLGAGRPSLALLPSASGWLGHYGMAHAWGSLLGGPAISLNRIAAVGIGHQSPTLRVNLGRALSAGHDDSTLLDVDYRLNPDLWLGVGAQLGDSPDTWGSMLRLGLGWE